MPTFINHNYIREANVFDLFAGSGTDSEGNPGSPLRIIKVIESYKKQIIDKNFIINLYFNEIKKRKFENLKRCTYGKIDEKLKNNLTIKYFNRDFKIIFSDMIPPFKDKANLMILDQNGIKQITPKVLLMLD